VPDRLFTRAELARNDGQDGRPALVAYDGLVYDVSASFLWRDGRHQVLPRAGRDLSDAFAEAPHGPDLLERFPVVGRLVD
jgi:predicted heme/steroid binding protein